MAATSISPVLSSASSFHGTWTSSKFHSDGLVRALVRSSQRMMGNVNEGKGGGVFVPLVAVARNVIGKKRFNLLRGKAIALHAQVRTSASLFLADLMNCEQVIAEFCDSIGAGGKQKQG